MIDLFGTIASSIPVPFVWNLLTKRFCEENEGAALFNALKLEISHNREMMRLCMSINDYPANAELVSNLLETALMDGIILNTGAHALVLQRLSSLQILQETEEENDEPPAPVSADQLLVRVAGRIHALKAIGRNASKIPAERVRIGVRMKNIAVLLAGISKAIE